MVKAKQPFFKTIEGRITKCNAQRRAGARAFSTKEEERGHKTHSRTNLNGGDLERSPLLVLAFAFDFAFVSTFVLALILAFGRGILTVGQGRPSVEELGTMEGTLFVKEAQLWLHVFEHDWNTVLPSPQSSR